MRSARKNINRDPSRSPDARREDAIHRALLAGLLSNIGTRRDAYEYTGARGSRFHIFPGSTLFKKNPRWVMAAELVETTRLYARTCAPIEPEWVERIADHLVKRTYADPHWNPATQHVVAHERVTLYGLPLIEKRAVHYGPIDPVQSRQIFIMHALVEGDLTAGAAAPFLRHNQRLIEDVERLEAKSRQRDLLVAPQARFDFYDARVPAGIHNGPAFEKWRRQAERENPKLLFMTRRDLMLHSAGQITQDLFPDSIQTAGVKLAVEYHFEPGHPADGVTVVIPLAALNQVSAQRFEWLVPGLLKERITALIKSLPKSLRVNFVPAPEFAEAAAHSLEPGDWSLYDALALFLGRQKGVTVRAEDFDPQSLLDHLQANFRIVDEAGKQVAMGRDLAALRRQLGVQVRQSFAGLPDSRFNREDVVRWDFGDLPPSVEVKRHGMTLQGYPALVEEGEGEKNVALRLLDSADAAREAHRRGVRRLYMIQLRDELRYMLSTLPGLSQLSLWYATLGPASQLKEELARAAVDRVFLDQPDDVRTAMEFELRREAGRRHQLLDAGRAVADTARQILAEYHAIAIQLGQPMPDFWRPAIADIRQQLAALMPPRFMTTTPQQWLPHLPRFLKGISARIQKLRTVGHTKDAQRMAEVQPHQERYLERRKKHQQERIIDPALEHYRWMIEELRISLFAQELKTSIPISPARLEKQWQQVRG